MLVLVVLAAPLAAAQVPAWPDGDHNPFGHSPIRIHLDLSNLSAETPDYAPQVHEALAYWEQGGNGALNWTVEFEVVDSPEEADIVFWLSDSLEPSPTCGNSESALGCARPFERPVPVEVRLKDNAGAWVAFRLVREVSMHELGHALGLPHSDDANDIMAAHARLRAATSWRPGDLTRLVAGTAFLLSLACIGAYVLWRALRSDPRMGAVHEMAPGEADAPCEAAPEGAHAFDGVTLHVRGEEEDWAVCRHCRRGLPVLAPRQ